MRHWRIPNGVPDAALESWAGDVTRILNHGRPHDWRSITDALGIGGDWSWADEPAVPWPLKGHVPQARVLQLHGSVLVSRIGHADLHGHRDTVLAACLFALARRFTPVRVWDDEEPQLKHWATSFTSGIRLHDRVFGLGG